MKKIVVCEPQCIGYEHVEFNSAFIVKLMNTFEGYNIDFYGDKQHLDYVKEKLAQYNNINYFYLQLPERKASSFKRIPYDWKNVKILIKYIELQRYNKIIFLSITTPALISLKYLIRNKVEVSCGIVLHGILETINEFPYKKIWKIPFWFRFPLSIEMQSNLKYILLGESIRQNILKILPKLKNNLISIDHPYILRENFSCLPYRDKIIFASVGVGHRSKGTDVFFNLAQRCSLEVCAKKAEFKLIGHVTDTYVKKLVNKFVHIASMNKPIDRTSFENMIDDIDYVVFCYPLNSYKFTASGAMIDAFSQLKPIIAIENDYFRFYFNKMGDIGYLCKDINEMISVIKNILNNNDSVRYQKQRENILNKRNIFSTTYDESLKLVFDNKNAKSIVFARAFHIDPEPRLEKAAKWVKKINDNIAVYAIGWDRNGKSQSQEIRNGINIERFFSKGEYGKGFRKNIVGLILFNLYLFYIFMTRKIDVIHACDLDTAVPAFVAAKIRKIKLVYDIYDFYSDNRNLGCIDGLVRKLEQLVAKYADLTIIADERRLGQLGKVEEVRKRKNLVTIYNTPEDIGFSGAIDNKYLIAYVGVLINNRRLVETAEIIKNIDDANIAFAGFGALENEIMAQSNRCDKILFFGKVDYAKALEIESEAKVILGMYDPRLPNNRYAAPNKLCEAMMLGKPIITSEGTLCAEVVRNENIGFVIRHEDNKALKDTIKYIQEHTALIEKMGKKSRWLYETKYSAKLAEVELQKRYKYLLYGMEE